MEKLFEQTKKYLLGIAVFYTLIGYLPNFSNQFYAPKLLIILFFTIFSLILNLFYFFKKKKKIFHLSRFQVFLILFLFSQLISVLVSQAPLLSFFGYYKSEGLNFLMIFSIIIFLLFGFPKEKKVDAFVLLSYLLASLISALLVIYQHFWLKIIRPIGFEGHPIWSASVIGLGLILIFLYPINKNKRIKYWLIKFFLLFIYLIALIILDSTLVFADLGIVFLVWILSRYQNLYKKINKFFLFFFLIVFLLVGLIIGNKVLKKEEFSLFKRKQELKMVNNLFAKEFLNSQGKEIFFGKGQSTSGFYLLKYKDEEEPFDKEWLNNRSVIHNQFLEILWGNGVIGFFIWIYLLIRALKNLLREKKFFLFPLWLFFTIWQMIYIFTPSLILFYFIFLFWCFGKERVISFSLRSFFVVGLLMLLCLFLLGVFYLSFAGEFYYSNYQKQKAASYQFWNEVFAQDNFDSVAAELNSCQRNIVSCNQPTIKYIVKRLLDLANKKLTINKLNPENWKDLATSLFYQYYYFERKNHLLFNQSLAAINYGLTLYPTNYYYFDLRGALYLEKKDYQLAESDFLNLFKKNPRYLSTIRHLIELYKQLGDEEKKRFYENILNENNVPACLR